MSPRPGMFIRCIVYIYIPTGLGMYIESWHIAIDLYTNWPWYISKVGIFLYIHIPIGIGSYRKLVYWCISIYNLGLVYIESCYIGICLYQIGRGVYRTLVCTGIHLYQIGLGVYRKLVY